MSPKESLATGSRSGFALIAALLAVVLMMALIAAVFLATIEETGIGAASTQRAHALALAESGIARAIRQLGAGVRDAPPPGTTTSVSDASVPATVVYITRLDSTLLSIVAEVSPDHSRAAASTRIGVVVSRSVAPDHSIRIDRIPVHAWSELF